MNPITNNQFLAAIIEEAAWKELSRKGEWTMDVLEKYQGKVGDTSKNLCEKNSMNG